MTRTTKFWLVLFAITGVPAIFFIYVFTSYWYALDHGLIPVNLFPGWEFVWFLVFGACITGGSWCMRKVFSTATYRLLITGTYAGVFSTFLLLLHLAIACFMGDCL